MVIASSNTPFKILSIGIVQGVLDLLFFNRLFVDLFCGLCNDAPLEFF